MSWRSVQSAPLSSQVSPKSGALASRPRPPKRRVLRPVETSAVPSQGGGPTSLSSVQPVPFQAQV